MSVLINMIIDISPIGDLLVPSIFAREMSPWACPGAFTCCASTALKPVKAHPMGNNKGKKKERKRSSTATTQKEEDEEGNHEK